MLKKGDYIGISACSDSRKEFERKNINELYSVLKNIGLNVITSKYIYANDGTFSISIQEKADALMELYTDNRIKAIFDISGGDMCNELLDKLDYNIIKENNKPFFGYSDLTAIINAIYSKTKNVSYLYQIKNIVSEYSEEQQKSFIDTIILNKNSLLNFDYRFIQGESMSGIVIGGNIRCLLKLAGTEYMPDFSEKILFLESLGGGVERAAACLSQLRQLGVFKRIKGIILGQFTYMTENNCKPLIEEIVLREIEGENIPIARTYQIGHSKDSKSIKIGEYYSLTI